MSVGFRCFISSSRELLDNYFSSNLEKIYLGDDQTCNVVSKGLVQIELNGSVRKLDDIRHVPNLTTNLVLIGQLAKDGYVTTFTRDS